MSEYTPALPPVRLLPRSALGSLDPIRPGLVFDGERLQIAEEPFLSALSLRSSRLGKADDPAPQLSAWGLDASAGPNVLTGSPDLGGARIEPQCWLLTSTAPIAAAAAPAGWLITEVSDRYTAFRLSGPAAVAVIAAGCDPAIVPAGRVARTRFAGMTTALIQRWSDTDVRVLVDVSLGQAFAAWLRQTAGTVTSD